MFLSILVSFGVLVASSSFELCTAINEYRVSAGVAKVQMSRSLFVVAEVHRRDLNVLYPTAPCTLHSWQTSPGYYSGCCYTAQSPPTCMFEKTRELTPKYPSDGYEVASRRCWSVKCVVDAWKASPNHNATLLLSRFRAVGCGYSGRGGASVAWFGTALDAHRQHDGGCLPRLPPIPGDREPLPPPCPNQTTTTTTTTTTRSPTSSPTTVAPTPGSPTRSPTPCPTSPRTSSPPASQQPWTRVDTIVVIVGVVSIFAVSLIVYAIYAKCVADAALERRVIP